MKLSSHLVRLVLACSFICLIPHDIAAAREILPLKKVLFFSKSSNYEHPVIKEYEGQASYVVKLLTELGPAHGVTFSFSKDGSKFSPEYLAQFDAFIFFTSGDLLSVGKDGNPPMTLAGKAALLDAVSNGKGFIGVHSAADTFHTGESPETNTNRVRTWRYRQLDETTDLYTRMLGAELIIHGTQQIGHIDIADADFPGLLPLKDGFEMMEEWYSMCCFAPDMHVLLVQDTTKMRDPNANGSTWPPAGWNTPYLRAPYPTTWARMHNQGRVFYTAMGHSEETWRNPTFLRVLFGGIAWATRQVDANLSPNIKQVTPFAHQLPPTSGPVPGVPKK